MATGVAPMDMEAASPQPGHGTYLDSLRRAYRQKAVTHWVTLALSAALMLTAFPAAALLSRFYYSTGGGSYWILSWAAVSGWPLTALLLPLSPSPAPVTARLALWCCAVGLLSAADNLLFAWAYAHLPASTASLLAASSLAFSALFGWAIAQNKLNLTALNTIVTITLAVSILALDSKSDGSQGLSKSKYALAFIFDLAGSAIHGLIFALSEKILTDGRPRSFHVAARFQTMVTLTAFVATSAGMLATGDFRRMRDESATFAHGRGAYVMVLVGAAICFQAGVQAGTAVVYVASTVLAGIFNAIQVPLTSVAAVVIFGDSMTGFKVVSLVATSWGIVSYTLGHPSVTKARG